MKKSKIVSYLLSAVMVFGCMPNAMAEENAVYTYGTENGETVNVSQTELAEGNWNVDYMSHLPIEQFEDFPVKLKREEYGKAQFRISGTYLKNVRENESVTFSVVERNTDNVFFEIDVTEEENFFQIDNIPMGKTLNLVVRSIYNDKETQYTAVIETYYGEAVMPDNISISEIILENPAEVRLKDMTIGTIYDEDENGNMTIDRNTTFIQSHQLPEFYNSINNNHIYEVQTNQNGDLYKGYITKDSQYNCDYVFTPKYRYYLEADYIQKENEVMPFSTILDGYEEGLIEAGINDATTNGLHYITSLTDQYVQLSESRIARAYEAYLLNTGSYTIKTYSNNYHDVFYAYSETLPIEGDLTWHKVVDIDAGKTMSWSSHQFLYIIVGTEIGITDVVLTLNYNGSDDDVCNFITQTNAESIFAPMNTNMAKAIEYTDDVDVYMPNCDTAGRYSVVINNKSTAYKLKLSLYSIESGGYYFYEDEDPVIIRKNKSIIQDYILPLSAQTRFYIVVQAEDYVDGADLYDIEIRKPRCDDVYESNNTVSTATDLMTLTSPINDATMDLGDDDFYKFTLGDGVYDISLKTNSSCAALRDIYVYTEDGTFEATGERISVGASLLNTTVQGNTTYIVWIRPEANSTYCSGHPYTFLFEFEQQPRYSAIITGGNINLTATAGGNIRLSRLREDASEYITFKDNGQEVASYIACEDLTFYYMDNGVETELTATIVNSLSAGQYILTARYNDVDVTGGTITLTLTE